MKNHELAPKKLIPRIAKLKPNAAHRALAELHKHKLIFHEVRIAAPKRRRARCVLKTLLCRPKSTTVID